MDTKQINYSIKPMILVKVYISCVFVFTYIDEKWNLDNPRIKPNRQYILCNWEKEDFYPIPLGEKWIIKEYREEDNSFKRKARRRYRIKNGYDKEKE
jgi:hypothetical protein